MNKYYTESKAIADAMAEALNAYWKSREEKLGTYGYKVPSATVEINEELNYINVCISGYTDEYPVFIGNKEIKIISSFVSDEEYAHYITITPHGKSLSIGIQ